MCRCDRYVELLSETTGAGGKDEPIGSRITAANKFKNNAIAMIISHYYGKLQARILQEAAFSCSITVAN